jgi:ABC-type nickel/cobalt efflux system permease component RcnA
MIQIRRLYRIIGTISATALLLVDTSAAWAAKSPFGVATPDSSGNPFAGPFGGIFAWVAFYQAEFYRALTEALTNVKDSGHAFSLLAALSFLYGVFHAVGPGHGKAVITSYLLASHQTVRRGIVISFAAALMQGFTAIAIVLIAAGFLRTTAIGMTRATDWFEIASYGLIAAVGAWLLWTKAARQHHHHAHAHVHAGHHQHKPSHHNLDIGTTGHHHACEADHDHNHEAHDCGHSHAPDPRLLVQPLTLWRAWAATLAVGIRPCSGAIIVLVFALSQNLLLVGIGSVLVMAFGTFLTVSALAALAVFAKDMALHFANLDLNAARRITRILEIGGALAVLLLGVTLLGGALEGGLPT